LAHLLDVWRAAAPSIDLLAPDIYDAGFTDWLAQYHVNGNSLFVPEIRLAAADAVRAFYTFGQHDAMGFSPFSIENADEKVAEAIGESYSILSQLTPVLLKSQGKNLTNGILFEGENTQKTVTRGNYTFSFSHIFTLSWEKDLKENNPEVGAILIQLSEKEYIIAGTGVVCVFGNTKNDGSITGIGSIDEVKIDKNGKILPLRRLNGDEDHQGRHLRIPAGKWQIQYVKLYDYK
jgi:hypothetical protein